MTSIFGQAQSNWARLQACLCAGTSTVGVSARAGERGCLQGHSAALGDLQLQIAEELHCAGNSAAGATSDCALLLPFEES